MAKIDALFKVMSETNGTDLHLSPSSKPLVRRLGDLQSIEQAPLLTDEMNKALLFEIMSEDQREKFIKTRDLDISYTSETTESRFRVNVFQDKKGMAAVFRLIPTKISLQLKNLVYQV
jgi:twitching motility protein PilT